MLQAFVISVLLSVLPAQAQIPTPPPLLPTPTPQPTPTPDPAAALLQQFITELPNPEAQGILVVSPTGEVRASHQPTMPLPAASLTKLAPTLSAIAQWGLDHTFATELYTTGTWSDNGRLVGDLWVVGGGDPYFVDEDAAALRQELHALGIHEIDGAITIVGPFTMNFEVDPLEAGYALLQGLGMGNAVQGATAVPQNATLIQRYTSLPLREILLAFNTFSNNIMAEVLALQLGGVDAVESQMSAIAQTPVYMETASGLGYDNQFSAAAVVTILQELRTLVPLADILPTLTATARSDISLRSETHLSAGTLADRQFPLGTTAKTGTINGVVTLAGELPDGSLFVLLNQGWDMAALRAWQDRFLQAITPL